MREDTGVSIETGGVARFNRTLTTQLWLTSSAEKTRMFRLRLHMSRTSCLPPNLSNDIEPYKNHFQHDKTATGNKYYNSHNIVRLLLSLASSLIRGLLTSIRNWRDNPFIKGFLFENSINRFLFCLTSA